jgi:sulfate transport system permease protein
LSDIETELEEAASALGANRWQTITKIILPILFPALLTLLWHLPAVLVNMVLLFLCRNQPYKTEIAPS